jgi:competence protein ComEC
MRRETLITAIFTFGAFLLLARETAAWMTPATLHVFDVGQGDGILISSGGYQIVVDGGPDGSILSHLGNTMPFFDRTIELLVLSHPDMDHIGGFPELIRRYRIGSVLFTGVDKAQPRYEEFLGLLAEERARIIVADPTKDVVVGNIVLDVLWPPPEYFGVPMQEVNENSVAVRVRGPNGTTILLTGDMGEKEESEMLQAGVDVSADILKVAHHGSRTSSSTGFLLAVRPSLALVSAGRDNSFGHPHADVMTRFAALGIPVRATNDEGTILITLSN